MPNPQEQDKEFKLNCGEILRIALNIESQLDFFLSNYFCRPQDYRTFLFEDLFLVNPSGFGFGQKVNVFGRICEREEIDKKYCKKIINAINYVKKIRNKVAHYEAFISSENKDIRLQSRNNVKYKKDEIKIDKELLEEVKENSSVAVNGIIKLYFKLVSKT